MVRPQLLQRALDDLSAIAAVARAAPDAARAALARTERIEKRLAAMQQELESVDKRVAKLAKRMDRGLVGTHKTTKAVESVDRGLHDLRSDVERLAAELRRDGDEPAPADARAG